MSFVNWKPPMGRTDMYSAMPRRTTMMSEVPPPMSMRTAPLYFSDSVSTALALAIGSSTRDCTPKPASPTARSRFST